MGSIDPKVVGKRPHGLLLHGSSWLSLFLLFLHNRFLRIIFDRQLFSLGILIVDVIFLTFNLLPFPLADDCMLLVDIIRVRLAPNAHQELSD